MGVSGNFWRVPSENLNINFLEQAQRNFQHQLLGGGSLGRLGKLLMICHRPPTRTKLTNHHQFLGIQHYKITCSARTRDLVKFDMTQTDTVNSPEGCSDIRRAPCVRFQHLGSQEDLGGKQNIGKTKQNKGKSKQNKDRTHLLHVRAKLEAEKGLVFVRECPP